jgi:hypothetical protein
MDFRSPCSFCWHRNRGRGEALNSGHIVRIFTVHTVEFLAQFLRKVQPVVHRLYRTDFYSPYNRFAAQISRRFVLCVFWLFDMIFKEVVQSFNTQKFDVVGMNFEAFV